MNAKSWVHFQNIVFPESLKHRLDNSLENDQKINCFCWNPLFGNMIACGNSESRFEWFRYSYINTLLGQVKGDVL